VYRGEEDGTEVVFVTHVHRAGSDREAPAANPVVRSISGVPRLVPSKPAA